MIHFPDSRLSNVLFVLERWCDSNSARGLTNSIHNLCGSLEATGLAAQRCFFYDRYALRTGRRSDMGLLRELARHRPTALVVSVVAQPWRHPSFACFWLIRHVLRIPLVFVWFDFVNAKVQRRLALIYSRIATASVVLDAPETVVSNATYRDRFLPLWTPQDPRVFAAPEGSCERDIDVCFLGSRAGYPEREQLLDRLRELPIRLVEGGGQREEQLPIAEYAGLLRRARIVVNFSRAPRGSSEDQVKGRVFEATLCGAMLLEMRNRQTAHWFVPERDYVEFTGAADLVSNVKWYLAHESERRRIAGTGCLRAQSLYTAMRFWTAILSRVGVGDGPAQWPAQESRRRVQVA